MFEGDLTEGELEIGQIASAITTIKPAATIVNDVWEELHENNVVMGVGRGSSVASYVLYLLGVHKIDSIKYNLDYREFFR